MKTVLKSTPKWSPGQIVFHIKVGTRYHACCLCLRHSASNPTCLLGQMTKILVRRALAKEAIALGKPSFRHNIDSACPIRVSCRVAAEVAEKAQSPQQLAAAGRQGPRRTQPNKHIHYIRYFCAFSVLSQKRHCTTSISRRTIPRFLLPILHHKVVRPCMGADACPAPEDRYIYVIHECYKF